jgi:uncharacterized protein YggE
MEATGRGAATDGLGLTVTGAGTVRARPDRADFSFGVETQGETAAEALEANSAAAREVIAAVAAAGVGAGDSGTQQVSVFPRYSENGGTIVGFTATNSVSATVRDVASAGAIVEAAVRAGSNQVHGPTFSISNRDEPYRAALEEAYADARSKAEALAEVTGVTLGRVLNVVEGGSFAPYPAFRVAAEAGVPIEPGLQDVHASLTVTFAMES